MCIALKEAREVRYFIRLLDKSQLVSYDYLKYLAESNQIVNILTLIVKTSQESLN
ncbi:four helix bundle protein [Solitalea koreensis]|uniref:Four helix bundle protein n=1 Tax=Solitalea koreensis TaxID=543615 RepID=A0A521BSL2_9SPHI|nr:four helix bundle protein [Solitalea koreensis]